MELGGIVDQLTTVGSKPLGGYLSFTGISSFKQTSVTRHLVTRRFYAGQVIRS
jgi:hypothetical protein